MKTIFCKNVTQRNAKTDLNFIPHQEYLLAKQIQNTFTTQWNKIKTNPNIIYLFLILHNQSMLYLILYFSISYFLIFSHHNSTFTNSKQTSLDNLNNIFHYFIIAISCIENFYIPNIILLIKMPPRRKSTQPPL